MPLPAVGFPALGAGYPADMQDSDDFPDGFPDGVPVDDAVEQQRAISEPAIDQEASAAPPRERPLETADADWHDQLETVDLDPDEGRTDD
jgi:hypothetical protein